MSIGNHTMPSEVLRTCTDGAMYCLAKWQYQVTEGLWFAAMLIAFCIALFMASFRYGTVRAFGFAAVIGLFGAVFLAIMQLMAWWIASIFIVVGAIGIAAMIVSNK